MVTPAQIKYRANQKPRYTKNLPSLPTYLLISSFFFCVHRLFTTFHAFAASYCYLILSVFALLLCLLCFFMIAIIFLVFHFLFLKLIKFVSSFALLCSSAADLLFLCGYNDCGMGIASCLTYCFLFFCFHR